MNSKTTPPLPSFLRAKAGCIIHYSFTIDDCITQFLYVYNTFAPRGKSKLKTAVMTLRIEPQIKAVAEPAAKHDRRSVTSLIEVLVLAHGKMLDIEPRQPSTQESKR